MQITCGCTKTHSAESFVSQSCVPGDTTVPSVTRETARMFRRVVDVRLGSAGLIV